MSKNDTGKLQTLFQLSINIYKIHERMVEEERDPTKFKMYLEQLRMNMELEEQIYQSLDIEEMKTYLVKYRRTPAINTVRDTQKMAELEKPFYRTICSLRDTRLWEEDPEIIGINDIHITEINRMQRAFKNAIHSSIVMKLKFILIYLNLLRRSKKSRNVKEHLDVLYMNRLLEMNLLDYQLRPLHFDQIDDFLL